MRKKTIAFIFILTAVIFLSSIRNASASYSETIIVDCSLDSDYSLISQNDNYTIYYANSKTYNFVFIEFNFNLSGTIFLAAGEFEYDISNAEVETNFLHSMHTNDTLELAISRDSVGDSMTLSFNELDLAINIVIPASPPFNPPDDSDDDDDDSEKEVVVANPMGLLDNATAWYRQYAWVISIPVAIFVALFIIFIYRYFYKPIIFVRDPKEYGVVKLGRYIENYNADKPLNNYWILKFKSSTRGVKIYYCSENFDSLRKWITSPKLPLEKIMAHIIIMELNLPEALQFPLKERRHIVKRKHFVKKFGPTRKDYANWFKFWFVYRMACFFVPSGWLSNKFQSIVKLEVSKDKKGAPINVTKIPVLVHEATLRHLTTVCDISYEIKTFENGKDETKPMTEKAVTLSYIESLKRDNRIVINSIKRLSENYEQTERYNDANEAMQVILSKAELQSIHELEIQKISQDLDDTKRKLHESNERARSIKAGVWDQIEKSNQTNENESILTKSENLIQIVARARGLGEIIGDDVEGIKKAIIEFLDKHYAEINAEDRIVVATLRKENEMLKENLKDIKQLRNELKNNNRTIEVQQIKDDLSIS